MAFFKNHCILSFHINIFRFWIQILDLMFKIEYSSFEQLQFLFGGLWRVVNDVQLLDCSNWIGVLVKFALIELDDGFSQVFESCFFISVELALV